MAGWLPFAAGQDAAFKEVYELLRTNLPGVTEAELNRAATQGFLGQLQPRVTLVKAASSLAGATNDTPAVKGSVFEACYGLVRIGQFGPETAGQFSQVFQQLSASNRLKGLVLDLRFCGGDDYASAKAVADQFFTLEQPLIDWGQGVQKSTPKAKAIRLPLMILVNPKTSGPAEALAAILRDHSVGLVLGSKTAGHANIAREFALSTGERLRIATAPVRVAREQRPMALEGLTPDIQVAVNLEEEQTWFADPYKSFLRPERILAASTGANETRQTLTNRSRRHINEAELVRMQREGQSFEPETNLLARESSPAKLLVQDPVLVRALDLLKGLAVVQRTRSP